MYTTRRLYDWKDCVVIDVCNKYGLCILPPLRWIERSLRRRDPSSATTWNSAYESQLPWRCVLAGSLFCRACHLCACVYVCDLNFGLLQDSSMWLYACMMTAVFCDLLITYFRVLRVFFRDTKHLFRRGSASAASTPKSTSIIFSTCGCKFHWRYVCVTWSIPFDNLSLISLSEKEDHLIDLHSLCATIYQTNSALLRTPKCRHPRHPKTRFGRYLCPRIPNYWTVRSCGVGACNGYNLYACRLLYLCR